MTDNLEHLKYPIGHFKLPDNIDKSCIADWIRRIETLPERLQAEVEGLSGEELNATYRPGGWSVRQVVHHLPDSHLNAYIRFKLALTEDRPVIRPYHEDLWAELADANAPIDISLNLLESLHIRWCIVLKSLSTVDLCRKYIHPEHNKFFKLEEVIGLYAWHGDHHLAHVKNAKK